MSFATTSRVEKVHYDAVLSNYAMQLPADHGMIADLVCPVIPVNKESDVYYIFGREELKEHKVLRADGSEAEEMEFDFEDATFRCRQYSLKSKVTYRMERNADAVIRPRMRATEKIVRALRVQRERRVALLVQSSTNWGASATPAVKWNNSGAAIEEDFNAYRNTFRLRAGVNANVAVINDRVRDVIVTWLRGKGTNMPTAVGSIADWRSLDPILQAEMLGEIPQFRGLFGIRRWLCGEALYDTAKIGKDEDLARVWDDACTLLYINPGASPSREDFSACYSFVNHNFYVKTFDAPEKESTFVEASHILDEKITATIAGLHIHTVLE